MVRQAIIFGAFSCILCIGALACSEKSETDPDRVVAEAIALMEGRDPARAIEKMRELAGDHPDDASIQALYGEALIAAGQPSLAVWPLSRAMRDPAHRERAGLLLATAQLQSGSSSDAVRTASRVLAETPESEQALMIRAKAYLQESLEEEAIEDLDRYETLAGPGEEIEFLRLDALLGLNREAEADTLLAKLAKEAEALREEDPARAARLCAATATFTFERGDLEGAKARYGECLEGDGILDPLLFTRAANFFDEHGELERSTGLFLRRFELDRDHIQNRVLYADRLQKVGRFAEGEALLREATETQTAAWAGLADLYAFAGDHANALKALDRAIQESPTPHEDWLFSKADFQLVTGDLAGAEKTMAELEVPAHRELIAARLATERGDLDTALKSYEAGIRLWPDNADARYLAARLYERRGEWKLAAAHYREAARLDPPHYESSLALASLQRALGDNEGVSFLLLRLADSRPNDLEVIEKLVEFAGDIGSEELGLRMLRHLARLPGGAARALVLASERAERAEGAETALAMIDRAGLDLADPAHAEVLSVRTRLLVGLERWEPALEGIERAMDRRPGSPDLLILRADMQRAQGDLDGAVTSLERARTSAPEDTRPLLELASVFEERGRVEEATKVLEEAVRLESSARKKGRAADHDPALALARRERATGNLERARARLRQILEEDPRAGEAAWMLLQTYADSGATGRLAAKERSDLALRAAVFERSVEARDYLNKLNAGRS